MDKLDFDVNKFGLVEAELLLTAPKELAKKSVDAYTSRSIRETERVSPTEVASHYMKGLFVNEDVDWNLIKPKLEVYKENPNPLGKMIEKKMGIDKRIFPPKSIERDFAEQSQTVSKNASFCKAEIKFDPKLMSKPEAINHLYSIIEEANEDSEWAKDLTDWLKNERGSKIYFVVGFDIICEFKFEKYWTERIQEISKDKLRDKIRILYEGVSVDPEEKEKIEAKIHDEVAELADYAVEYVVEKLVFYDLRAAFKHMCEEIEKRKKTADTKQLEGNSEKKKKSQNEKQQEKQGKTPPAAETPSQGTAPAADTKPPPENRFLFYTPLKLKLITTLNSITDGGKKKADRIHLGDQIEATIRIESEGEDNAKPNFKVDKSYKVVIADSTDNPSYFELGETKEITFVDTDWKPVGNGARANGKFYVETKGILTPKIDKITEEYKPKYPVTFNLKRSSGILATTGGRVLAKSHHSVDILPPIVTLTRTKPRLPRKGEQFDIKFKVKCEGNSKKPLMVPLIITGYFGPKAKPDFQVIGCEPTETYPIEFKVVTGGDEEKTFSLLATRASFPGYYGIANFDLTVGATVGAEKKKWKIIKKWRENMIIFPNLVDTFVAGGTTLLGVAYLYRPDLFPFIPEIPALNIANLEAIPAVAYLGYRVLKWTKTTSGA